MSDLPLIVTADYDHFCNEWGSLRLRKVQHHFGYDRKDHVQWRQLCSDDLTSLVDLYTSWRDTDEVVPIKYVYADKQLRYWGDRAEAFINFVYDQTGRLYKEYSGHVLIPTERNEWRFPIATKRGNAQYIRIIKQRLASLIGQEPLTFFERDWGTKRTNMLYLTLTVDPVHCDNDRGWLSFGSWWNSFITNLRQQFGRSVYVRAWQSHESGFPHCHALIYFADRDFNAVKWDHPNGKVSFRLASRASERSAIKRAWRWGTVDIVCVDNTQDAFKDLLKYVTRDLSGGESDLTNALVWYFQRQAFGISRDFAALVWGGGGIDLAEPGNADLIEPNMYNSNFELLRIEIYPTLRYDLLFEKVVQHTLFDKGKPPPDVFNELFLENLVSDCDLVECKSSGKFDCPVMMYRRR